MQESLRAIGELWRHDPAAVLGFLVLGATGSVFIHIELKMTRAGYKTSYAFFGKPLSWNGWDTPFRYLKVRSKHGWSPWPAYLIWPGMVAGFILLVFGLFHLAD